MFNVIYTIILVCDINGGFDFAGNRLIDKAYWL